MRRVLLDEARRSRPPKTSITPHGDDHRHDHHPQLVCAMPTAVITESSENTMSSSRIWHDATEPKAAAPPSG